MPTKPLFLGALAALSILSLAQAPTPTQRTVDLKVEKTDVREALRAMFKQVGISYTIAPEVQGAVSADFRGLVLEDALSVVLRQVRGVYRIESGIYLIVPNRIRLSGPDPTDNSLLVAPPPPDLVAVAVDGSYLYVVRGSLVHKLDKRTMKEVGRFDLNGEQGGGGRLRSTFP